MPGCKDADMGEIRVGGRNNVVLAGRGDKPVVMLANGFGCDQNMWRLIAPGLAGDYRVVLFDHVGSGGSELSAWRADRYATLDGYADDIVLLCHELGLHRVVLVAHSVSAMMAVLAAIREPELFSKLILIGPSPRYIDDAGYRGGFSQADIDDLLASLDSNYLGWSAAMAPVIMGNPERPALSDELSSTLCRTDPEIARAFARTTFLSDNRSDLHRGYRAHPDPPVFTGRDRASRGRGVCPGPDPREHLGDLAGHRPLPAPECTRGDPHGDPVFRRCGRP